MMKRITVLLFVIITAASMVFGAGKQGAKSDDGGIVWAGWSGEVDFPWMMENWNQQNPSKKITWVGWPWEETATQMLIRSQGNEKLDIAQADTMALIPLAGTGVLADWTDLVGAAYLKDNFEESALSFGNIGGKQYGLPWVIASIGMVYNPEILARAGYREPPKTIAEFEQCLEAVAKLPGDIVPYGVCTKDSVAAYDFIPWLWTFGGRVYDRNDNVTINNQQGLETFAWYKSLIDRNLIRTNVNRDDSRQLFAQGKMAFYDDAIMANGIAAGNGVPQERLDAVIRPMVRPVLKAGDSPRSMLWGHMLIVFNKSTVKADTVELAKYIVGKDAAIRYYKEKGMLPVLKSALASPEIQNDVWANNWSKITATGEVGEFDFRAQVNQLNTILGEELQACLTGSKTPQKAADDAATRIGNAK
jgi:multiple sugar transport system substrate-binding protein